MVSILRISALLVSALEVAAASSVIRRSSYAARQLIRPSHTAAVTQTGRVEPKRFFWDTCTDNQIGGNYVDSGKSQAFVLTQTDCALSFGFGAKDSYGAPVTHTGTVSKDDSGNVQVIVDDWYSNGIVGVVQSNGDIEFNDTNTNPQEAVRHWTKQQAAQPKTAPSAKDPTATTADPNADVVTATADPYAAATTAAATVTAAPETANAQTTLIPYMVPVATTPPDSAWWTTTLQIEWVAVPVATNAPPDAASTTASSAGTDATTTTTTTDTSDDNSWFR